MVKPLELTDSEMEMLYSQLVSIRNVEIDQFWRRFIILIGIQGVVFPIFIGSFSDIIGTKHDFVIFLAIVLGFLLSVIITLMVRSNAFWKRFWENKLIEFEETNNFKFRIFEKGHPPKKYVAENKSISSGYLSATDLAFALSVLFTLFWLVLLVYYSIKSNCFNDLAPINTTITSIASSNT
ncbi:hypothetical protein ABH15_09425 [Methanoculleus taiwanensis]|uniref:Uncharacterized protein n=1 Tax=Methanoculleus taiwanensis TaxID=1550565 RepID=A0A498H0Z5_9EURY|nr:hypothetical protein ABH15_09425 [Methanoculleus taiwanensis]